MPEIAPHTGQHTRGSNPGTKLYSTYLGPQRSSHIATLEPNYIFWLHGFFRKNLSGGPDPLVVPWISLLG